MFLEELPDVILALHCWPLIGHVQVTRPITKVKSKDCSYPNVELHELLHVLGFDHSENKKSIMYQLIESCDQILDQSIINQLKLLYAEENLPDLYFDKINVIKKGRYLPFIQNHRKSCSGMNV